MEGEARSFACCPSATEGHAFFGDKGIQGQQTAWRMRKLRHLAAGGYELCSHTLWHANLSKMSDVGGAGADRARAAGAWTRLAPACRCARSRCRSASGRRIARCSRARTLDRPAHQRTTSYALDAILMVAGGPARSPFDTAFDPLRIPRVQVFANELETLLDQLDRRNTRYVSPARAPNAR
ncbi:MAG: hypothetical protein U5L05_18050 [Rubrivivax sp.]|nr:hypothetical protein [Rubrivivax sp.]